MLSDIKEARNKLYHHRINLSALEMNKEVNPLIETNKNLHFIIRALDESALALFNSGDFEKKLQKLKN